MKKIIASLTAVACAAGVAACGGSGATHTVTIQTKTVTAPAVTPTATQASTYPPADQTVFLKACEADEPEATCACILGQLEATVPLTTIENYTDGTNPSWLTAATAACVPGSDS